ncbi:MAG: hypothetical protein ACLPSL_14735 [Smithella sp.]
MSKSLIETPWSISNRKELSIGFNLHRQNVDKNLICLKVILWQQRLYVKKILTVKHWGRQDPKDAT